MGRTFAIGDVHGDSAGLDRLLARLPALTPDDTLVFLGDYVDRGPDGLGVVARVRALAAGGTPARVVTLRGNHEDKWIECWSEPDAVFLLSLQNGCAATFRSFSGGAALQPEERLSREEIARYVEVPSWFPRDLRTWMETLPFWHEDEHAIYVHAGLEGEGTVWKHPRESSTRAMLWMREPDFYSGYQDKRLVFGHTIVDELPGAPPPERRAIWRRDPHLIGIDTGAGKDGWLSAIELPALRAYDSR